MQLCIPAPAYRINAFTCLPVLIINCRCLHIYPNQLRLLSSIVLTICFCLVKHYVSPGCSSVWLILHVSTFQMKPLSHLPLPINNLMFSFHLFDEVIVDSDIYFSSTLGHTNTPISWYLCTFYIFLLLNGNGYWYPILLLLCYV